MGSGKRLRGIIRWMAACAVIAGAQDRTAKYSPAIEDNSFFIEEAYNQEENVVQHIWTLQRMPGAVQMYGLSVTEEWPIAGVEHQFSYTLPYTAIAGPRSGGVGDVQLHYRYQYSGSESWAAFAPRFTFSVPSGTAANGLGSGSAGVQVNLPVSKRVSESFVVHANAGWTTMFRARGERMDGSVVRRALNTLTGGGSIIWLTTPAVNLMFEAGGSVFDTFDDDGIVVRRQQVFVNPGARVAVDVGDLQIVPGAAFPVFFQEGRADGAFFLYLSFEHPF